MKEIADNAFGFIVVMFIAFMISTACSKPAENAREVKSYGEEIVIERIRFKGSDARHDQITFSKVTIKETGKVVCYGFEGRGMQTAGAFQIRCEDVFGE
jgi:hypothetical protein